MENNNLKKTYWEEIDFHAMQWHDCKIYAIAFDSETFELLFDIDYIIEWVKPNGIDPNYKFWMVPATLVFKNVHEINMDIASVDLIIQNISRSDPAKPKNVDYIKDLLEYKWTIETSNGELSFKSVAYEQFARRGPVLLDSQAIGFSSRGGISFYKECDRSGTDQNS